VVAFDALSRGAAMPVEATPVAANTPATSWLRLGLAGKIVLLKLSFALVTAAAVAAFVSGTTIHFLVQRQQEDLNATIRIAETRVSAQFDAAARDTLFLLQAPAMQGFVRAASEGAFDPVDDSSLTLTRTRVGELFAALLAARPTYAAIHFIDRNGYDAIEAERGRDGTIAALPPSDLTVQKQQPYFAGAVNLAAGSVYVAGIDLAPQQGAVAGPRPPVARLSIGAVDDAHKLIGVIVLSLDASKLFKAVTDVVGPNARTYVADEHGDYLVHPDQATTFGFDQGKSLRIQDDYPALAAMVRGTEDSYSLAKRSGSSATLFSAGVVPFDALHPERRLIVAAETAISVPYWQMFSNALPIAGLSGLVLLLSGATALVLLRILVIPLRRIRAVAVDVAAGRRGLVSGALGKRNDEIGDLAKSINFMSQAISEREDRLTSQAAELRRSNQDLAQFAYVASHDLQEPLRMVSSYLELLSRRYKGKLDQEADEFIGFAVDGATRMKRLINDLLGYSRAGNTPLKWQRVDVAKVLGAVRTSLAPRLDETGGSIDVGPMPTVTGDASQLERVFQNLIDNALKYNTSGKPRIRVSAASTEAGWKFAVADNGIGIDVRFKDQIFEIFKRLHGRDQYSGTGIGLAVTKLVVERHGGQIWVEPGTEGGSVFYFTIPEARTDG
jgi:signal transduction histidine kinase